MSVCIIYHSETGNTRSVAERVARETGADLVEVKDLAGYSKAGMYLKGAPRAMRGEKADIQPESIDVSGYDTIVLGSPVWAFSPTPAVNAAIDALQGIEGKNVVVFCTSGGMPGRTLETMKAMLGERGATVRGAVALAERELKKADAVDPLIDLVRPRAVSSA
ncbi:ArsR family transcriptional regulator [Methanoculleus taiwanensis]|uniref:ArsR family transcriptional regulator n=1 Tax=Methanoculleus taiwanensis TaxID=1550565 RepID=A0A498H4F0_9EURY|nr:flavodoxin [Methanoculleus taiwanensis]RXE56734.1 ArsR family transcriptional regulator [Methanoculleus taiwanensis]